MPELINQDATGNGEFWAVAHVLWELPFPLRLPPKAFPIWEPAEGVAAFAVNEIHRHGRKRPNTGHGLPQWAAQ